MKLLKKLGWNIYWLGQWVAWAWVWATCGDCRKGGRCWKH